MSHVVAYPSLVITDLDVLAQVAESIGLKLVEGTTYKWYGRWMNDFHAGDAAYKLGIKPSDYGKCDGFKLVIPGDPSAYEIGLHKDPAGSDGYVLVYDFFGPGQKLKELIGEKGEQLKQNYTLALSEKQMKAKGFRVAEKKALPNGKVMLKMQRGV